MVVLFDFCSLNVISTFPCNPSPIFFPAWSNILIMLSTTIFLFKSLSLTFVFSQVLCYIFSPMMLIFPSMCLVPSSLADLSSVLLTFLSEPLTEYTCIWVTSLRSPISFTRKHRHHLTDFSTFNLIVEELLSLGRVIFLHVSCILCYGWGLF